MSAKIVIIEVLPKGFLSPRLANERTAPPPNADSPLPSTDEPPPNADRMLVAAPELQVCTVFPFSIEFSEPLYEPSTERDCMSDSNLIISAIDAVGATTAVPASTLFVALLRIVIWTVCVVLTTPAEVPVLFEISRSIFSKGLCAVVRCAA